MIARYAAEEEAKQPQYTEEDLATFDDIPFQQKLDAIARGVIEDSGRGAYDMRYQRIILNKDSDVSTILHELSHMWLNNWFKAYRSENAPESFRKWWRPVERALGIRESDRFLDQDASEKFARSFEKWVLDGGKGAESSLTPVFERLSKRLADIYDDLATRYFDMVGDLKPEVQSWFAKNEVLADSMVVDVPEEPLETKAVDEKGVPVTVYHGSENGIHQTNNGLIFFATNKDAASNAGKNITEAKLKMEKPFIIDAFVPSENEFSYGKNSRYDEIPVPEEAQKDIKSKTTSVEPIAIWAKDNGYDGLIIKNMREFGDIPTDDYVVFNKEQVITEPQQTEKVRVQIRDRAAERENAQKMAREEEVAQRVVNREADEINNIVENTAPAPLAADSDEVAQSPYTAEGQKEQRTSKRIVESAKAEGVLLESRKYVPKMSQRAAEDAVVFATADLDSAFEVAMGRKNAPGDVPRIAVFFAVQNKLMLNPVENAARLQELALNSPVIEELSRAGQTLREAGVALSKDSPMRILRDLSKMYDKNLTDAERASITENINKINDYIARADLNTEDVWNKILSDMECK
jgi:Zn-dependent peptidase ImmA (M78 family)